MYEGATEHANQLGCPSHITPFHRTPGYGSWPTVCKVDYKNEFAYFVAMLREECSGRKLCKRAFSNVHKAGRTVVNTDTGPSAAKDAFLHLQKPFSARAHFFLCYVLSFVLSTSRLNVFHCSCTPWFLMSIFETTIKFASCHFSVVVHLSSGFHVNVISTPAGLCRSCCVSTNVGKHKIRADHSGSCT